MLQRGRGLFDYNFHVAIGASSDIIQAFAALVRSEIADERIDLLRAALTFARVEDPALDIEHYVRRVDALAKRVAAKIQDPDDPTGMIAAINAVLFQEEVFRGNTVDYYSPRNSFLQHVLDRQLGIPISLALVYMEVAQRVGFPLYGVGMPGHFLLKHYDVSGQAILIDAFERGSIVSEEDCQQRLKTIYSGQITLQPEFLLPVTRRQMLTRMLNNLRSVYLSQRDFRRTVQVVDSDSGDLSALA